VSPVLDDWAFLRAAEYVEREDLCRMALASKRLATLLLTRPADDIWRVLYARHWPEDWVKRIRAKYKVDGEASKWASAYQLINRELVDKFVPWFANRIEYTRGQWLDTALIDWHPDEEAEEIRPPWSELIMFNGLRLVLKRADWPPSGEEAWPDVKQEAEQEEEQPAGSDEDFPAAFIRQAQMGLFQRITLKPEAEALRDTIQGFYTRAAKAGR
jgi:hypothetical protein